MKNITYSLRIITLLFLLTHVSLHAVHDPYELQQVGEEIRQSVSKRIKSLGNEKTKLAIWDIAEALPLDDLKQFFPKGCRNFKAIGSFNEHDGVNVVRTWFTYADFSFSCIFFATFSTSSLKRIALLSNDTDDVRILWIWDLLSLTGKESLTSN